MSDPRPTIPRQLLEAMSPEALRIFKRILERADADPDRIKAVQDLIDCKEVVRWMEEPLFPDEFREDEDA